MANHRRAVEPHVFSINPLRLIDADRDGLVAHLGKHDIPCGVYYPVPLHAQKAYADPSVKEHTFPVTNQLVKDVISLPMHSELSSDQIEFIAKTVLEFLT